MATTAVIGDIHQQLDALDRTLAGPLAGFARIVAAGDFLDRGPASAADMLDHLLATAGVELLAGNHELAYLGGPLYNGMVEDATLASDVPTRLRDLAIDGKLRCAAAVGDVLVVHGGVTAAFWSDHLRARCGSDPVAIARELNRQFVRAVAARDFRSPLFASLRDRHRGPFWARLHDDLLEQGLPPLRQAVGHVESATRDWIVGGGGSGAVFPLCWQSPPGEVPELVGHLLLDD